MNNPQRLFTPIPFIRRSSAGRNCGKARCVYPHNREGFPANPLNINNFPNLSPPLTPML
jgi:hypothetical protein